MPSKSAISASTGRSWLLSASNKTTALDAAYRYHDSIIIFGWIGCCAGITTILAAGTGSEQLEFLGYDPHITPKGLIVFRRFYPHFTDPSLVSDFIKKLDINQPIPNNVPSGADQNPTEQIGMTLYPKTATPQVRDDIGHNFLITGAGTFLFVADRLSSGNLCLVRLSLGNSDNPTQKDNCVTPASFGVNTLSDFHISQFAENPFGDLILSADLGQANSSIHRDFEIDKTSLVVRPVAEETPEKGILPVPWTVQKNALVTFAPFRAQAEEVVKARLVIDTRGNVASVLVSGAPEGLSNEVKRAILNWKFKPTVLNGKQINVVTEFSAP